MFQFGSFSPVFRSHGSETSREIWEFGEFTPALIKFDRLRYRLMPYIYSLAWMVTSQDYTMMRGLPMDFPSDSRTFNIGDQFMFGPAIMVCPVSQYMYYRPPEPSILISSEYFQTPDGKPGLLARYFKDTEYHVLGKETIDPNIDFIWYTGRPDYVTDSTFAVRWQGKLIPQETGKHQFHLISYDNKRIILNGDTLHMVYTSVEQYSEPVSLEAGKSYDIIVEVENRSTGAARMRLFWKTPGIFARETAKENREKSRQVYLPVGYDWYDFWTGMKYQEGSNIKADAPIEKMPLFVKAGSIIPMGPFIQYTGEKAAEPIELRIYPGADGDFSLYEDEGDNYNYENGVHSTIPFHWDDNRGELTIGRRQGKFPGMLAKRTFKIVLISENRGTGVEISKNHDQVVAYDGQSQTVKFR
jgi:alpha-D-xyloside xylohydrolase